MKRLFKLIPYLLFFALAVQGIVGCGGTKSIPDPNSVLSVASPAGPLPLQVRIAFGSCINDPETPFWEILRKEQPDVMLFLGDNIYQSREDFGERKRIRAKYEKLFSAPGFQELREIVPMLAVWDDHDFGPDNSDSSYEHSLLSLAEFRRAWPDNPAPPAKLENSVVFEAKVGPILLIGLDNRTYRRNPSNRDPGTMFGEEQLLWLENRLKTSKSPIIVLAAGNQWLATNSGKDFHSKEMLAQYPEEKERILNAIDRSPSRVLLLSGDKHYAEVLLRALPRKRVLEVTSSPIQASFATAVDSEPDGQRLAAIYQRPNVGLLTINVETMRVDVELIGSNGKRMLSLPFILQAAKK